MHEFEADSSRRRFLTFSVGGLALFIGGGRAYARSAAEQQVAEIGSQVIRLANSGAGKEAMRRRFASLVNRYASVRSVGLLALGPYQQVLPANRREQFFRLVADYIAAFFVSYIDDFRGSGFEVKSSFQEGRSTIVNSKIIFEGRGDTDIAWRVTGGRVSDVKVSGIWLSLQLKKRFTDILKRTGGDFGSLFEELESAESW